MSTVCAFPLCSRHPESNGYCIGHRRYASGPVAKAAPEKIEPRSDKMKDEMKELARLYGIFLAKPKNKNCLVKIDSGCTGKATVVHHVCGREGKQKFEQKDWLPSCAYCNIKLEQKDGAARDKGVKKSKFSTMHKNKSATKK